MIEFLFGMVVASGGLLLALNLSKKNMGSEDRWLQAWLGVYCLMSIGSLGALYLPGVWGAISSALGSSLIVLTGPFLYFFAKAVSNEEVRYRVVHFIPFGAIILLMAVFLLTERLELVGHALVSNLDPAFEPLNLLPPIVLFLSLAYPATAIRAIGRRRELLKERLSALDDADLNWIKDWAWSTILFLLTLLFAGVVTNTGLIPLGPYVTIIWIAFCIQLLYVGFRGLRQTRTFGLTSEVARRKVATAPIPEIDRQDMEQVGKLMAADRPYLDAGITIGDFSDRLGWGSERVSQTLRHGFKESYFDFINRYRVEEAKRQMSLPENARVTILALAMDAGFGSKSTFNKAFLKYAGETPSQYRRKIATG